MNEEKIMLTAIEEVELKSWGITQQFLEIHQIIYADNKPTIERIDRDKTDGSAIVYFPVKDEKFHFAICVATKPEIKINGIYAEPYISVCFSASSETIDLNELVKMTTLQPTSTWKKGDLKRIGSSVRQKFNILKIEPNPGPHEFHNKMNLLLDVLETDKAGISKLVKNAGGYIQVAMEFHNGNTMLGGPNISQDVIQRLAALNLAIDFDLYVGGKSFK